MEAARDFPQLHLHLVDRSNGAMNSSVPSCCWKRARPHNGPKTRTPTLTRYVPSYAAFVSRACWDCCPTMSKWLTVAAPAGCPRRCNRRYPAQSPLYRISVSRMSADRLLHNGLSPVGPYHEKAVATQSSGGARCLATGGLSQPARPLSGPSPGHQALLSRLDEAQYQSRLARLAPHRQCMDLPVRGRALCGLVDKSRTPKAPARKVWLALMMEVYHLQKRHPDAGGFRIWSLLARPEISVRTRGTDHGPQPAGL